LDNTSVTSDKLTKPRGIFVVGPIQQATVAAQTGLGMFQAYGACTLLEVGMGMTAAGTAASTIIDVHRGATRATSSTVFGAGTKLVLKGGTASNLLSKVATPSGTLGTIADNAVLFVDVDAVASGTKSGLSVWLVCKELLQT